MFSLLSLLDSCFIILPYWSYVTVIVTGIIALYPLGGVTSVNVYFQICDCGAIPKSKYNCPFLSVILLLFVVNVIAFPTKFPVLFTCCAVTVNSVSFNPTFVFTSCLLIVNSVFVSFLKVTVTFPYVSSTSTIAFVVAAFLLSLNPSVLGSKSKL